MHPEATDPKHIIIYTDGACAGNPGPGGYGAVLLYDGRRRELSGGYRLTTNNRMELLAAIVGLEALKEPSKVTLYSDSRYLVDAMTKGWARRWQANNWQRKTGEMAANVDLWERLLALCERHDVEFVWVRGHAGNPENERADFLSYKAIERECLPADEGFENPPAVEQPPQSGEKITREGQPCRKCGTPVVKKTPKRKRKPGQQYYFEYYLSCPNCGAMYLLEDAKRFFDMEFLS